MTTLTALTNPAQANAPTVVNANFDATSAAAIFGKKAATTTGLTWGYYGGMFLIDGVLTSIADGTIALTGSATNYVEATRDGVVSANTTGFTAGRAPLYTLVCSAAAVTTTTDSRAWIFPAGIESRVSVAVTTADVTLTAAQARCDIINVTGALTANRSLIVPNGPQSWCVTNNTTGGFTLTVKTSAGTGVAVTQGKAADLLADGTNVVLSNNDVAAIGGALLAANNLSDVSNAATARTNLGVDAAISAAVAGLSWKQAVRAATAAAGTLATSFANASVIDGVTLATGDRILIKNQAAGAENGIYVVAASGAPTRATDADSGAELVNASVYVSEGTTLADTQWTCSTNAPITVGTTALAFAQLTSGSGSTLGRHAVFVAAGSMQPSAVGGCAALTRIASAANQPDILTLDFDATTQEYAQFGIVMPKSWDEGTLIFKAHWSHAATTTNFGVVWDMQAVAVSDLDPIAVAFGTAATSTDTGGTTNTLYSSPESAAITVAGTPAPEDMVFFRISRVVADAGDTMAIDARLHGITFYMTTNAGTDA